MKLISEEVASAEYLIEERTARKNTKSKVYSYNQISKIEMEESILENPS